MASRFSLLSRMVLALALGLPTLAAGDGAAPPAYPSLAAWGEALFFDPNLSANRRQSCASCHDPARGFADPRGGAPGRAASLGDDGVSLGDRNAPSAAYAALTPVFGRDDKGDWIGGQFLDGRAATLEDQAAGPILNPIEMGMPDVASVLARLQEDPAHEATLRARLGADAGDPEAAYREITAAIAAFERTPLFQPFDSRYDRALRGEIRLTEEEELGRLLFFSKQFTNCNICHLVGAAQMAPDETFSNYRYFNIGVPENTALRAVNGRAGAVDRGLGQNPAVTDGTGDGRFKVPGLRNVAVTGPYMHNGIFADLETVVRFYNRYNSRSPEAQINPETGVAWRPPEVPETVALQELAEGPALDEQRIRALVAFLKTLTDARYEGLLGE